jgi:aspartyl-tRNA(Asn)/glutamyl-tRNA(Gln) amidotransferase subunit C
MSVDQAQVKRIARLARLAVEPQELPHLAGEINAILGFVEQLSEVDVSAVEAMTSVTPIAMKKRQDIVNDGGDAERVLKNAPAREDDYFVVPKVVE